MTYISRPDITTSIQHRFVPDLYGQGVGTCEGCGKGRDDRDHDRTAPAYAVALITQIGA